MKKFVLFAALLLTFAGANAQHNFDSLVFTKMPGISNATLTFNPARTDSMWKRVVLCHDSLFTSGIVTGPVDSGFYVGMQTVTIPVTGVDTTICYARIISWYRDTATFMMVRDTTNEVVMNKIPTLNVVATPSDTAIPYTLTCNGGNPNHVQVLEEAFDDATELWNIYSHTFYVSGPATVTISNSVPSSAGLSPGATYYLRTTITNPVTGSVIVHTTVTMLTTLTSAPYLQVGTGIDSATDSVVVAVGENCFGHPSVTKVYLRDSLSTVWIDSAWLYYDSTVTGLQNATHVFTGLIPAHAYVWDVYGKNTVGGTWMGSQIIHTLDTVSVPPIDTSTTFHVATEYAVDSSMGVNAKFSYHGNGTDPLTMDVILKDQYGSVVSTHPFAALAASGGSKQIRFVVPSAGLYYIEALISDNVIVLIDSSGTTAVHVAAITTGIEEVNAERDNISGSIWIYSMTGSMVCNQKGKYGDIRSQILPSFLPTGMYIANFITENGEVLPRKKLFKN